MLLLCTYNWFCKLLWNIFDSGSLIVCTCMLGFWSKYQAFCMHHFDMSIIVLYMALSQKACKKRGQRYKKITLTGCEWVMHFLNEHMWDHPPVKGEGSAALRSWEIWLAVWSVTICLTLHITTSPHHCAANHAKLWKPNWSCKMWSTWVLPSELLLFCVTQNSMIHMFCCNW